MACEIPLVAPLNDPCAPGAAQIGKQFVGLFYQDAAGTPPTMTSISGIQAGLTATGADKLYIIKNLAASTVAEPADQTITGNDVAYGGTVITERTRTVVGQMQYLSAADVATNNQLNAGNALAKRVWWFDDLNTIQGPYENATIGVGGYIRAGAGQALPNRQGLTMTHRGLAEPAIGAPIPGLAGLVNVA